MHPIYKHLIRIYKKHNPSKSLNFRKTKKIREEILDNKLKFPLRFFSQMEVADIACGTGDFALIYGQNGAKKVKGYDFNEDALAIAKKNKKKLKIKNVSFEKKEFFSIKNQFDFVSCTGVLHILPDPMKGLNFLTKRVKRKGFLFIAFGTQTANVQHNLMKLIINMWGKDENKKVEAAKIIFPEHIRRSVKYGVRSEYSVIYDQFINERHYFLDIKNVLNSLKNNFTLHATWPNNFLPRGDSTHNNTINENLYENYLFSLVYWSLKNVDDKQFVKNNIDKKFLNNFRAFSKFLNNKPKSNLYDLIKNSKIKKYLNLADKKKLNLNIDLNKPYSRYHRDIEKLLFFVSKKPTMKQMARFVKSLDYLFKGTCGLGLNYFLFKKK